MLLDTSDAMGVEALRRARSLVLLLAVVVGEHFSTSVRAERLMTVLGEGAVVFFSVSARRERSRDPSLLMEPELFPCRATAGGVGTDPAFTGSCLPIRRCWSFSTLSPLCLSKHAPERDTHTRLKNQSAFPRTLSPLLFFFRFPVFQDRNYEPQTSLSLVPRPTPIPIPLSSRACPLSHHVAFLVRLADKAGLERSKPRFKERARSWYAGERSHVDPGSSIRRRHALPPR